MGENWHHTQNNILNVLQSPRLQFVLQILECLITNLQLSVNATITCSLQHILCTCNIAFLYLVMHVTPEFHWMCVRSETAPLRVSSTLHCTSTLPGAFRLRFRAQRSWTARVTRLWHFLVITESSAAAASVHNDILFMKLSEI